MDAVDKEHKEDDNGPVHACWNPSAAPPRKRLNLISILLGNCMCTDVSEEHRETQFIELHGLRFIGLGALAEELSPKERVYDTLEQLTTRSERLVSIGYFLDKPIDQSVACSIAKTTMTIPLDVWNKANSTTALPPQVLHMVDLTTNKQFSLLQDEFARQLRSQKSNPNIGHNKYLAGITAHNLGVLEVIGGDRDAAMSHFREAICLKEAAFGRVDPSVAESWDELGIQFFARGDFDGALTSFREAHAVRQAYSMASPHVAMVLNNMACCYFQMGDPHKALSTLQEADEIQQKAVGSQAQADLDLLHVAIVMGNIAYLQLALKQYDEARSLLDEVLLIQQSVLDDTHRAVRDTLSNIEFANAFHS